MTGILLWVVNHISILPRFIEKEGGIKVVELSDNVLHTCPFLRSIHIYNKYNILPMLYINLSLQPEAYDNADQAAYYHILGLQVWDFISDARFD
jgi:hypothetical protein